jgi:hypothetical protein
MTRTFKTKKELAERLMAGEKWRVVGYEYYCYYDETRLVPFRYSGTGVIHDSWGYCDGTSQWEQVIDKQQTKTVWFWRVRNNNGEWLMPNFMDTEDEIRRSYPLATQFKRMDILGSEEVVL